MQFVLIIYHGTFPIPGSAGWQALAETEKQGIYAEFAALQKTEGIALRLPPLAPHQATTVQVKDGKPQVRSGPNLTEGIGGAFVLEADNLEAAIAVAARIPQARLGGAVEIRPVEKYY